MGRWRHWSPSTCGTTSASSLTGAAVPPLVQTSASESKTFEVGPAFLSLLVHHFAAQILVREFFVALLWDHAEAMY